MLMLKIIPRLFTKFSKISLFLRNTKFKLPPLITVRSITTSNLLNSKKYEDTYFSDSDEEFEPLFQENPMLVRDILYPHSDDPLIQEINSCASIQEVFNFIDKYKRILNYKHLTQIVLSLWDLQKMFYHVNVISNVTTLDVLMKNYVDLLINREEFNDLLTLINNEIKEFDVEALSCILIYLKKIGLDVNHYTMQQLINHGIGKVDVDSLPALSRYMVTLFSENNINAYFICQDAIKNIYEHIEKCTNATDLKLITICLNCLHKIITDEVLLKYKNHVGKYLNNEVFNKEEITAILKIALFLNYPQWRDQNTNLINKCINLLRGNLNLLNVYEIILVCEIFQSNQEPGDIQNELQRHAYKFFHELEEDSSPLFEVRLKLLKYIVTFCSLKQRQHLKGTIQNYLNYNLKGNELLLLNKILNFAKLTNANLYKHFWDKILLVMEHDEEFRTNNLLKICYTYLNSGQNFRNFQFEKRMNHWIEGAIECRVYTLFPSNYSTLTAFVLPFGLDVSIINFLVNKIRDNWEQLRLSDCLSISKSLQIGLETTKNPNLKPRYVQILNETLNKFVENRIESNLKLNEINLLIKNCVLRNQFENEETLKRLLRKYNKTDCMSSQLIKNVTFCLYTTNGFIPKILEDMVNYVIENKDNILAVNAEKVAYLCYFLGYVPKRSQEFSQIIVDIILRDQDKLTGLSYLQGCLALCYFNALPESIIKQIFNTTFLEKLDLELSNCYSKNIYPARVRHKLMELNRTICIDYPEMNIPWFHEKYVQSFQFKKTTEKESIFVGKVGDYLQKVFEPKKLSKNVMAPYGYHIDYVIEIGGNKIYMENETVRFAVLLLNQNCFTSVKMQLKGQYQLKARHLEMFGYRVTYLNYSDWRKLLYGEDKVNYIRNIFLPKVLSMTDIHR